MYSTVISLNTNTPHIDAIIPGPYYYKHRYQNYSKRKRLKMYLIICPNRTDKTYCIYTQYALTFIAINEQYVYLQLLRWENLQPRISTYLLQTIQLYRRSTQHEVNRWYSVQALNVSLCFLLHYFAAAGYKF